VSLRVRLWLEEGALGGFLKGGATENSLGWNLLTGGWFGKAGAGIQPSLRSLGMGVGKVSMGVTGGTVGEGTKGVS
jgi:hypothetical protein